MSKKPEPPEMNAEGEITRVLREDPDGAEERIFPLVYDELRSIAQRRMARERRGHTLQATALVHEAYGRLLGEGNSSWHDRRQFYAAAARAMQVVLVDHARRVRSDKRGGDFARVTLGSADAPVEIEPDKLIALDAAMARLQKEDPRAAEVTRFRFFVGCSVEETARAMGISERSVAREWAFARARLMLLIAREEER